jgi:hypothetical protein
MLVAVAVAVIGASLWAAESTPAQSLVKKIDSVSFTKEPLAKVFEKYAQLSGLAVECDWEALKAVGLTRETPVSFKAANLAFDRLLDATLVAVAPPKVEPLAWYMDERVIRVSTQTRVLLKDRLAPAPPAPAANPAKPEGDAKPEAAAPRPQPPRAAGREIAFDNTPLKPALEFVRDLANVNMHVNWKALETSGISPDTAVTVKAKDISPGRALDMVLDQLNATHDRLSSVYWLVDDGVVEVTTGEVLNRTTKVEVYDIADLLFVVPNFVGPAIDISTFGNNSNNNSTGGGMFGNNSNTSGGANGGGGNASATEGQDMVAARQKMRDDVVATVKETIGEDMWAPTGKGSIRIMGTKLVITQTQLGFKLLEKAFAK